MAASTFTVRPAVAEDMSSVNGIHKYYVLNTVITFIHEANTDDATLESYNKIRAEGLPYLVAVEDGSKSILGYCYVSGFRGVKLGYRHSLELSIFCHPQHVRRGVGKALLTRLIDVLEEPEKWNGYFNGTRLIDYKPRQLLAIMSIDTDGPGGGLKLRDWYVALGFEQVGHLKEVGWKKERWIDTVYLQRRLKGNTRN